MHQKKINFAKFSSIKIGPIKNVLLLNRESNFNELNDYYILGAANNLLISNNPPPLMILEKKYSYIKIIDNTLEIGCATPSGKIVSFCKKHNIANFEFLSHLPGTLGGIIKMNAGVKEYEIFNHLLFISTQNTIYQKKEIKYGYRFTNITEIIFSGTFELKYGFNTEKLEHLKSLRNNQPNVPSAGSCFKNPPSLYAGKLIEEVGLKGYSIGEMQFSTVHANFLINNGNGTFQDAVSLINLAKNKVYEIKGIELKEEIIILDS